MDPTGLMDLLDDASERVLATLATLDDDGLRAPSTLPGWSRGHVVAHIARNGDGMRNLLLGARTGAAVDMYPRRELRVADIEAGSSRSHELLTADLAASVQRFGLEARHLPADAWARTPLRVPGGPPDGPFPARLLLVHRLMEVEIHHADLDAGHTLAAVPPEVAAVLVARMLQMATAERGFTVEDGERTWTVGDGSATTVSGPPVALLAWLARGDGTGCRTTDGGELPAVSVFS